MDALPCLCMFLPLWLTGSVCGPLLRLMFLMYKRKYLGLQKTTIKMKQSYQLSEGKIVI